jgi:membrane-associated phospholipid phosphatase
MAPADTNDLDADRDLWAIDRWAAGTYSPAAALASDALIFPLLVLPMAATAWDSHKGNQSWRAAFEDAVVYGEACALSSSLDLLARSARVHPRPLVYGKDVPADERLSGEASGSFYSGHANGAFLSAVYFSYTYSLRHPESDLRGWLWAGSLGTAAAVSGLRVAAGKHYLSDVVIGAAAGSFFGWIFPYMHRSEASGLRLGMAIGGSTAYPVLAWRF